MTIFKSKRPGHHFTILCFLLTLLTAVFVLAACGEQPAEKSGENGTQSIEPWSKGIADNESQSQGIADNESQPGRQDATEPQPASIPDERPEAEGGALHKAYDLSFYLPDWMEAMKYNGVAGVYEFYTGTFNGSPTGLDFAADVYGEAELKGETLETYVQTRSRSAAAGLTSFVRETYNGYEWLVVTNGTTKKYYYAVFNGGLYCLLALQGADSNEHYLTARDMLEKTLFFSID